MPTWATSANAPSGSPGSAWCCPLSCSTTSARARCCCACPRPRRTRSIASPWGLYPMVALATVATVIASQAVISGAFSLTRQAVQLGYSPRVEVDHTSEREIGQIYIPGINWTLMICTIALVLGFRSSTNLAAAYGVAVTTTMAITTVLLFFVERELWHWKLVPAIALTILFLFIDLSF